jgi:hypothetical protein
MLEYTEQIIPEFVTANQETTNYYLTRRLKALVEEELEKNIKSGLFDDELPDDWMKKIDIHINGSELTVRTQDPAIIAHETGVEEHPQLYLLGETVPIETDTPQGTRVVFRKCTPRSLQEGKFWHPGMQGKGFIEEAIDAAMNKRDEIIAAIHKPNEEQANIYEPMQQGDNFSNLPGGRVF